MCIAVCVCRRVYLCAHTRTVCVSVCLHYCMCLLKCACCSIFFILWQFLSRHANLPTDHTQHVCLIHVCVHCMCYVISYVRSILVICHEIVWLPDGHPSSSRMSLGLLEPLALATLCCTSYHAFMPEVAMWPHTCPWWRPHCVYGALCHQTAAGC